MYQSDSLSFFVLLLYINGFSVTYSYHSHLNTQTNSNSVVSTSHGHARVSYSFNRFPHPKKLAYKIFIFRMVDKVNLGLKSAQAHAKIGVLRRHTRSHVCSTVTSAATNACVFHQAHMVIKKNSLATTTGKHRKENLNVLD
ncbi:hypothetical protein MKW98_028080 [Papaver atlanticum]|uniref:Uncharacterized protein n=1 Tax=Papaver atlanticum TaxID=357466 RepID=A0AAD4XK70_9MAGN|nr:hypothetical protein MKW98_028080 [Papaver atlanticum]